MKFQCLAVNVLIGMTSCTLRVIILYSKLKRVTSVTKSCMHTTAECPQPLTALEPVLRRRSYDTLDGMPVR